MISCRQYNYTMGKNEFFGDGAVDIIAKYFTMEVYIQCKCLASRVGPKIVRELVISLIKHADEIEGKENN